MIRRRSIQLKTPEQILKMRKAGLVVAAGLQAMVDGAKPGVSTAQLNEIGAQVLTKYGATSNFLNYGAEWGYTPYPASLCASTNDTVVHGIPDDQPLADGDIVSLDFGAILEGWHGDACRTVLVGGTSDPQTIKLDKTTKDAMWAGIAQIKPGARIGDIGAAISQAANGFGVVREFTGHGIGTEMHMLPDVPNYGRAGKGLKIEVGMVICIEPIFVQHSTEVVELDDDWTVKTRDGGRAAHWENTVAVMPNGLWVLTEPDGGKSKLEELGVPYAAIDA